MAKYYFRPNLEVVKQVYLDNTGREYDADDKSFNALLIVEADNEEACKQVRIGITDITMWDMIDPETVETI